MNAERWRQVKQLLDQAIPFTTAERVSFLDEACRSDSELRSEVESLLTSHDLAGSKFLSTPVIDISHYAATAVAPSRERRIGPYELVDEIGHGGMGEVYRAIRADGQYQKQVAIKLVRGGFESRSLMERFRNERQILASLDHPNIARLLDGGATSSGIPYLVMELVEGVSIERYCEENQLSITARLRLFRQVCEAVQYAHQRMVIHRDIKPSNIIVGNEGVPKLLDFGIAKLLDPSVTEGNTLARPMTPEYASPEQIRGEPITASTDVYSLGVVLYEILTAHSPYQGDTSTPHGLARAICDDDPVRPSAAVFKSIEKRKEDSAACERIMHLREDSPARLHRRLKGDLDNIVLLALRKEPSQRYSSVEQFSEDIRRHLENLPLLARKDTIMYRSAKFVRRHRFGVLTAALVVALAVLSMAVIVRAELKARAEQAIAERRFNDVRKLAKSMMFEIHDSIRDLPGAMPARKLLVDRAVEYLDSLSRESAGDLTLQRELAAAYDRVGDLLGFSGAAHLGDFTGASQNYKKALAIRERLAAVHPDDATIQYDLVSEYFRLSFPLSDAGDIAAAMDGLRKGLPLAQKLVEAQSDPMYRDVLAGFYWRMGSIQITTGEYASAAENFRRGAATREPIALAPNSNAWFRSHLAADYLGVARALRNVGDNSAALEAAKKSVGLLEELSRSNPSNATLREYLGEAYFDFATSQEMERNPNEALQYYRKANRLFADLKKEDATNSLARANFGFTSAGIAQMLLLKKEIQPAMAEVRQAIVTFESIEHKNLYDLAGIAESYWTLGTAYEALAKRERSPMKKAAGFRAAQESLQNSVRSWQEFAKRGPVGPEEKRKFELAQQELATCDRALARL